MNSGTAGRDSPRWELPGLLARTPESVKPEPRSIFFSCLMLNELFIRTNFWVNQAKDGHCPTPVPQDSRFALDIWLR
jgi:hypothetical protein